MTARANAAIMFEPSAFDTQMKKVMGRNVAGASFLEGFVRHAEVDRYVGLAYGKDHGEVFRRQIAVLASGDAALSARPVETITAQHQGRLAEIGTLFVPDPQVPKFAARRRHVGQRSFSICGITHTISSEKVMELLCDQLTAPVQPWDAVICTSKAVRAAAQRQIEHHAEYLERRVGARPSSPVQMPVIPLGVDAGRFERLSRDGAARAMLRERIGAAERDIVVLFFGRLVFHAKAHPVPMYLGLQRAARRLGRDRGRLHLVQTGHFPSEIAETSYREGAARYCPDVAAHFLDGSDRVLSDASWAAADIFVTLSDNIQESFGITPVEAMAAGLPCVVSDWDGYRDTVVDGETGIRVPTWQPPPGMAAAIADAYALETLTYDLYIGYASQMTAVDVPAFAHAIETLARDPERRRQMGEAGRRRARALYDWSRIVPAYQDLWAELAERRRAGEEVAPPNWRTRNSRLTDPLDVFAAHASAPLAESVTVRLDPDGPALDDLLAMKCNTFAAEAFLKPEDTAALVGSVRAGAATVGECLARIAVDNRIRAARTIAWLAKYGVLILGKGTDA